MSFQGTYHAKRQSKRHSSPLFFSIAIQKISDPTLLLTLCNDIRWHIILVLDFIIQLIGSAEKVKAMLETVHQSARVTTFCSVPTLIREFAHLDVHLGHRCESIREVPSCV